MIFICIWLDMTLGPRFILWRICRTILVNLVWYRSSRAKKTLSQPMKALGADLENNLIVYNNNPVDKWCLCNTAVDVDKNDNIQPIKTSKPRRRIDGTATLLDAYVVLQNNINDYMSLI